MLHDASPEATLLSNMADAIWHRDAAACARLAIFCATTTEDLASRLHIHASTTWNSLADALKEAAPSVAAMLSPQDYAILARDFIAYHPPARAALHDWGHEFADFLTTRSAPEELVAMAQLDRAWMASFFSAEAEPVGPTALARCAEADISQVRLVVHPSIELVRLEGAWFDAWCARAALPQVEHARDSEADGTLVVVSRPRSRVRAIAVTPATFGFLTSLQKGELLMTAYEAALREDEGFKFQSQLAEAFAAGLITDCLTGE